MKARIFSFVVFSFVAASSSSVFAQWFDLNDAQWEASRVEIIGTDSTKMARLRHEVEEIATLKDEAPDVVFRVSVEQGGLYALRPLISVEAEGVKKILEAKDKFGGLAGFLQINDGGVRQRFFVSPPCANFEYVSQNLGKFWLPAGESSIRVWLPKYTLLKSIRLSFSPAPKVPEEAEAYRPSVVPPASHPRIWVTQKSLPLLRNRVTQGENALVWQHLLKQIEKTRKLYADSRLVQYSDSNEARMALPYDAHLLEHARSLAFVALVKNDSELAREAIDLVLPWLQRVDFGNAQDYSREVGETMYSAALVYDWLYPWLKSDERKVLERRMVELGPHLECSWPPFGKNVFVGHGNESMILRDSLSVAIALHDVDPRWYRYCMWIIAEQLVPARAFQYESPRHNQGRGYGFYRCQWELMAALMLRSMSGDMVFDKNILNLRDYLIHMRVPTGELIPDGDGGGKLPSGTSAKVAFMLAVLGNDPLMKGEYLRADGLLGRKNDLVFFLLLNDPHLEAEFSYATLPRAINTGDVLPSHILRTGWMGDDWMRFDKGKEFGFDPNSNEVIVEYKGGGWNSFNHQHLDAGAFQIYYRGWQTVDLGVYYFYGTPYDIGFHKKSGAHNCLFVMDPNETSSNGSFNDGGQRVLPHTPSTLEDCVSNPLFRTGKVLQSSIEPDVWNPKRAVFKVDLAGAYSAKVQSYIRTFVWLNTERADVPVVLIVRDEVVSSDAAFEKSWQINTLSRPQFHDAGFVSEGPLPAGATIEPGRLALTTLLPPPENRRISTQCVSELPPEIQPTYVSRRPDRPEAKGWRTRVSPIRPSEMDEFLNVLQVLAPGATPLEVELRDKNGSYEVLIEGLESVVF